MATRAASLRNCAMPSSGSSLSPLHKVWKKSMGVSPISCPNCKHGPGQARPSGPGFFKTWCSQPATSRGVKSLGKAHPAVSDSAEAGALYLPLRLFSGYDARAEEGYAPVRKPGPGAERRSAALVYHS